MKQAERRDLAQAPYAQQQHGPTQDQSAKGILTPTQPIKGFEGCSDKKTTVEIGQKIHH